MAILIKTSPVGAGGGTASSVTITGQKLSSLTNMAGTLGAGATSTSSVQNVTDAAKITGYAYADQDGTLYIEQSRNGVDWRVISQFSTTAGTGLGFSVEIVAPYIRARFTNNGTTTANFEVYIYKRVI